jgi:hypothetical protein
MAGFIVAGELGFLEGMWQGDPMRVSLLLFVLACFGAIVGTCMIWSTYLLIRYAVAFFQAAVEAQQVFSEGDLVATELGQ